MVDGRKVLAGAQMTAASRIVTALPAHFSVADFLALNTVRRGAPEVLAGAEELQRPIRWVHSGEVSNMASLLKGGELLLTTGMGLSEDEGDQDEFVAGLAQRGVVAIAIELGTSLPAVPAAVISACERLGVCLIAFRREVRFVDITEAVHRRLLGEMSELNRRGDNLHSHFTKLLLNGAQAPELLAELARFTRNPVILEGEPGTVAYHVPFESDGAAVLGAWECFVRGDPSAPATLVQVIPLEDGLERRLVIFELDSPLHASDAAAIERAIDMVAIALMRDGEADRVASRQRGDFLSELESGSEFSESTLAARASSLGFERRTKSLLPIVAGVGGAFAAPPADRAWDRFCRELGCDLRGRLPFLSGTSARAPQLSLVLGLSGPMERPRLADLVASTLRRSVDHHFGTSTALTVCVGPVAGDWREVGAALASTVAALPAAAGVEPRPWHDVAAADVDRLLWGLRQQEDLRGFVQKQLGPLLLHDRGGRTYLLETLTTYCECGGRKTETARALHIERRSLYHRLARIEEILGIDLADGGAILGLHLALRARRYVSVSPS